MKSQRIPSIPWLASPILLLGIGRQLVVNREDSSPSARKEKPAIR
jgi:hypothetical protein